MTTKDLISVIKQRRKFKRRNKYSKVKRDIVIVDYMSIFSNQDIYEDKYKSFGDIYSLFSKDFFRN